jgi:hypothetical protein
VIGSFFQRDVPLAPTGWQTLPTSGSFLKMERYSHKFSNMMMNNSLSIIDRAECGAQVTRHLGLCSPFIPQIDWFRVADTWSQFCEDQVVRPKLGNGHEQILTSHI